ncbi:1,4-dihydroxy-2-naphthoate polyprenyltransferase [Flavobacteriaceae bacterium R38]|nr:1,4-dihydroxy-2-naphthoate polyprenyltransferase [Flavobacteriaceae bacterium R38]
MTKTGAWLSAARLRTLPLSISGIIVGGGLASSQGYFDLIIFLLSLLTTIGFQVLSNFSNDYGDGVKGTDNDDRIGPERAIQSGMISPREMKRAMLITTIITLVISIFLIYRSFGTEHLIYFFIFFLLGIAAIAAAIKYTVGNSAYGYQGLGDVFVFIFFGLVSVVGSYFLYTKTLDLIIFLPAISIGLLSVAVLNLNNMRDRESDARAGKNTLVVKMGGNLARKYHYIIVITAMISSIIYSIFTKQQIKITNLMYIIAFIPLIIHLVKVYNTTDMKELDPELKKVALSTFLFSILFALS